MRATHHQSIFWPLMGMIIALAWAILFLWEQSPFGNYLHGSHWKHAPLLAAHDAPPVGDGLTPIMVYMAGWILMTAAMMLPTTLPLIEIFRRLTFSRDDHITLVSLLMVGYLSVWGGFGVLAYLVTLGISTLVALNTWAHTNVWVFGGSMLVLAGAFQFSSIKYRCLDKCRTPLNVVLRHWRGQHERSHAFLLGAHHGLFCVGCCWALMMLMVIVGTGSVGWMLVLGSLMAIEKNLPWGKKLSAPLGIVLITCGASIFMAQPFT